MNIYNCECNENIPLFSLDGYIIDGKIKSIYDGDSMTIIFPLHEKLYSWKCRLSGIDTPELRSKNEKVKNFAYKIRNILREKLIGQIVTVKCGKFDKYGRILVTILHKDCNINDWLIKNEFAIQYDGKTKFNWEKKNI